MKIAFFGTPIFSATILENLVNKHQVVACVTAPDARSSRGKKINSPEAKKVANKNNIFVYQPKKLDNEFFDIYKNLEVDIAVVVSYGRIIPDRFLQLPKYGFINIHASILPRWRGAAPIHRAILAGDTETGISIMQMDKGLDTGDVHKILKCKIENKETTASLHDKLLDLGINGILDFLSMVENSEKNNQKIPMPKKQDDSLASYAHKIKKEMAFIDWSKNGISIERLVRGLNSYPSAKTSYLGNLIKIHMANFIESIHNLDFGSIESLSNEVIRVACKGGFINITKIQKAGSRAMHVSEFLKGNKINKGDILV